MTVNLKVAFLRAYEIILENIVRALASTDSDTLERKEPSLKGTVD